MNREHLEKLNGNPGWKAEFESALAKAEALRGFGSADALAYAAVAADLAIDQAAIAQAEADQRAQAEAARIRQLAAEAAARPIPAADAPNPAQNAQAGWAKAFGTGAVDHNANAAIDEAAQVAVEGQAPPPDAPAADAVANGWAKAFGAREGGGNA